MPSFSLNLMIIFLLLNHFDIYQGVELKSNNNIRIFHPSFPLKLKDPISNEEFVKLNSIREKLQFGPTSNQPIELPNADILKRLPWYTLPQIGILENLDKEVYSKKELDNIYEGQKYKGLFLWANKLKNPLLLSPINSPLKKTSNCFLLNHWNQKVIHLLEYDPKVGAKGYELSMGTSSLPGRYNANELELKGELLVWPPFTLEMEIADGKWQPVEVSDSIAGGELFLYLPPTMQCAPWEVLFLLLLSPSPPPSSSDSSSMTTTMKMTDDDEVYQTLFDTGLSPKQGVYAYLRLLDQVVKRAEIWEDVPAYRKVSETEIPF